MNRVVIILPYFGKFPDFFPFWLQSCANNPKFDFLILTDCDQLDVSAYANIRKIEMSFAECVNHVRDNLKGREVNMTRPYKLCDYKPLYGIVFQDFISGYEFWGYCDCDLIFGDISKFVTDEILDKYRFIGDLGHFHLQKIEDPNYAEVLNATFTKSGKNFWSALAAPENNTLDELPYGVPATYYRLFPQYYYSFFCPTHRLYDSLSNEHIRFVDTYNFSEEIGNLYNHSMYVLEGLDKTLWKRQSYNERKSSVVYKYQEGTLRRYYIDNAKKVCCRELLYVHFYKRKLHLCSLDISDYVITPNFIRRSPKKIDDKYLRRVNSYSGG